MLHRIKRFRKDGLVILLRAIKFCRLYQRTPQIRTLQLRRAAKHIAPEISIPQISATEIYFFQVRAPEVRPSKSAPLRFDV